MRTSQVRNTGRVMSKMSFQMEVKELDKIEKIGEDAVKANLRKYANANQILTLFKMLEKPLNFFTKK